MKPILSLIGAGYWGSILYKNLNDLGFSVKYICDLNKTDIVNTTDINDILKDNEVSGVLISTPPKTHFEITKRCLEAGKHVFVEKPLTLDPIESSILYNLATTNFRILMVDETFTYSPEFFFLKQVFETRMFGRILSLESHRANWGPFKTDVNVVWDLLPHDLSIILPLNNKIQRVYAIGTETVNKGIIDNVDVLIDFANGFRAKLFASWLHRSKTRLLKLTTEVGIWSYDSATNKPPTFNGVEFPLLSYTTPLMLELGNFYHKICENDLQLNPNPHIVVSHLSKIQESLDKKSVIWI